MSDEATIPLILLRPILEQLGIINTRLDTMAARLDRLEAAVIIQTGTVFGAQGDSDPMTIEHVIPPGKEA